MKKKTSERDGERVIQVRSDAGKLLYVKTKEGYELKCSRSKQVCLIKYEEMLSDCLWFLQEAVKSENENLLKQKKELKKLLSRKDKKKSINSDLRS